MYAGLTIFVFSNLLAQMLSNPICILLVIEHQMVRRQLSAHLMTYEDLKVIGEAANYAQALELCANNKPDVVIVDMNMLVLDGVTLTRALAENCIASRIIAISLFRDENEYQQVINAGAYKYLVKGAPTTELLEAIREARSDE